MYEWSEMHKSVRGMFRSFCEKELVPHIDALENETMEPYDIMRKFFKTFGLQEMLLGDLKKRLNREREAEAMRARGEEPPKRERKKRNVEEVAMRALPVIELSRHAPGLVTALGVSMGLTANSILSRGSMRQKETFVEPLLKLDKIGAWAITEPGSGSDAFGAMRTTARRDGDDFVLNGQKTFITNGPYADTIILYAKLDEGGVDPKDRPVVSFILDGDTPGLVKSKRLRKMGMHSSPTGELFLEDVRVGLDRLMGESVEIATKGRKDAKSTFQAERSGVPAMALGMIERCLELSTEYARTRVQFGKSIGEFQLIQLKLAKMEVARVNVQNMLFRAFELEAAGHVPTLAEASASKLYAAQATMEVCLEAVQLHGGNGYMSEYRVEQLARDAKVLQIYGGTDEIQVSQIARDLLGNKR